MTNILMIEDDLELAEIIAEYLEKFDMKVDIAHEPYIGLSKLALKEYQLIILDLSLPGLDGLEVCEEIRKKYDTPIIISSARHDISDKVNALELGADDYLPKPYNPKELQARIKSHLRRIYNTKSAIEKSIKDLIYDQYKHIITMKGQELVLTNAEFDILSYLIKKEGGVVSREELVYNCSSIGEDSSNKSIDVIISRIRQKMGDDPKTPKYIHSIRGIGYKLTQ
ncbi:MULTISPECIES: response regulator transcription factor [unclassified Campylobacter]|uniref:response regulator transcription factor n=1 Tax=unclassified Campylobacter TaxID=2593542 RepID=UPI001238263F|nr:MULTISPECIES: response regulator transcription factor [unclassified Campylobacter]KAA6225483.1 response regulator transcription factor [Campylobacter sp. LR196d]KAA6227421.1 response regulator transcription factor [Campylobacter sp. LR185c]KAA6229754.1 response regulator transcription factor [Campylobacter sp. LR286c]KAA6234279.1 response regulator transcription factor [Campylobacter sp. LR291e]KAA6234498.1 response regulator transcription factor [Campylobacter sp. LR264d]